jgi:hypothetical protein
VRVGQHLGGQAEQQRNERREVQLGPPVAHEAVAVDEREARAQVGRLVGRRRVVGQPDGDPQGEARDDRRADDGSEPPTRPRPAARLRLRACPLLAGGRGFV